MLKLLKSVSMMLFLMGLSTGAAYAVSNTGTDDVRITQQSATCTGVVTDSTGETVIGASVVVKGTTNGTITGLNGDFTLNNVKKGDIIVAEKNFGCGSSREHAPIAIKASGVSCVIAATFARIFYRNAINIGFPIVECPQAAEEIQAGDQVEVDFSTGVITDTTQGKTWKAAPFPEFIDGIIQSGGLLNSLKERELGR